MILHRQVAQQRASLERLINNRHIYSTHVITLACVSFEHTYMHQRYTYTSTAYTCAVVVVEVH